MSPWKRPHKIQQIQFTNLTLPISSYQVLKPIPNALTQSIRTFAKSLEIWLSKALEHSPSGLRVKKVYADFIIVEAKS